MELKKLVPWNWFKKEETGTAVPVHHTSIEETYEGSRPITLLHREIDQLFENFFKGFGFSQALSHVGPFGRSGLFSNSLTAGLMKPTLDIGADDKEYVISVEIPGVDEKNIQVEVDNNTLTIKGEKGQEHEEKERNYYRMERSYGSFQRLLALPEDANQDKIKANFKNGVLTITMPKKSLSASNLRQIPIH